MKKHMNTIEAFEQDIKLQENFIKKFKPERPLSKTLQNKAIFCLSSFDNKSEHRQTIISG